MPRKFLNKLIPDREAIYQRLHRKWYMRPFNFLLHEQTLWHAGRHETCRALALGAFICCLPLPGHMLLALLGAFYLRANLPVALAAVWINNPVTFTPIYYVAYKVGSRLLLLPRVTHEAAGPIGKPWMPMELARAWHVLEPLMLGGMVEGLLFATIAYFALDMAWRLSIRSRWKTRQQERLAAQQGR
jgi:uncharacterized protein